MRWGRAALLVWLALAGCAPAQIAPSPVLAVVPEPPDASPRLWYVGLGMYGETWSENDVAALPAQLRRGAPGFRVIPAVFGNGTGQGPQRFPAVEPEAVPSTLSAIGAAAGPDDVVLVYVSTHGAPGLLGRSTGAEQLEPVDAEQLGAWLAPLGDRDTVLILSACFSGSFVSPLRSPHRIIFTAARADRTSFGCQAGAEHTVFGDALLRALATPRTSLRDIVAATRAVVAARERALRVGLPSQPQLAVGAAVTGLYDAPVF